MSHQQIRADCGDMVRSHVAGAGVTCAARESPCSPWEAIDWQKGPYYRGGRSFRRILELVPMKDSQWEEGPVRIRGRGPCHYSRRQIVPKVLHPG